MTTNKDRSAVIERRSEVFRLDCSGMPATEIAARLGVSVNTVSHDLEYIQREWDERGTFLDIDYDPDGAAERDPERSTPGRKEPPLAPADGGTSRRAGGGNRAEGQRADTVESCAGAAAGARRPWWLPGPAGGGMPEELREAIAGLILPAYEGLVLEAPSILERVAGELLVQALWAGCVQQLKYKRNSTKALSASLRQYDTAAQSGCCGSLQGNQQQPSEALLGQGRMLLIELSSLRAVRRGDFKSAVGDDDAFLRAVAVKPATSLRGVVVVLRHIRLDVQQRRAVQNIQLTDVQSIAGDLVQTQRG